MLPWQHNFNMLVFDFMTFTNVQSLKQFLPNTLKDVHDFPIRHSVSNMTSWITSFKYHTNVHILRKWRRMKELYIELFITSKVVSRKPEFIVDSCIHQAIYLILSSIFHMLKFYEISLINVKVMWK